MRLGHVDLRDLALQAGARVEQDDPAEAGQAAVAGPDGEDDVLALEAGAHLVEGVLELLPAELRVVVVVRLLVQVQLDQQRPDQAELVGAQPLHNRFHGRKSSSRRTAAPLPRNEGGG